MVNISLIVRVIAGSALLIALGAGAIWLFDDGSNDPFFEDDRIVAGATIVPVADITEQIGGEHVRVVQIVPPGASPHSYTLTPAQVADLQAARVTFAVGHGLDNAFFDAVESAIVTVDKDIELRAFDEDHGHEAPTASVDPHYWLNVPNAQQIAQTIAEELSRHDPAHAQTYEANLAAYLAQLDSLEEELQTRAAGLGRKEFIAIHDAWSYFAPHYGLELVATYEPVEGQEPSIRTLRELGNVIEQHSITTFYTEPQKQSTAATRFMREEFGLDIKVLDPIGGIAPRDGYIELMRANMQALEQGI